MALINAHALLVGVGNYQNQNIKSVPVTAKDAEELAKVLRDPTAAAYPPDNVKVLSGSQASRAGVLQALQDLSQVTDEQSTIFIFLCGHGEPAPDNGYYFLSYDARLRQSGKVDPTTVVSHEDLVETIQAIKAKKLLVIFNTCFSGAMAAGENLAGQDKEEQEEVFPGTPPSQPVLEEVLKAGEGRYVLSACRSDQKSWFRKNQSNTLFVQCLLEGLRGQGGIPNRQGYIGFFELYDYVYEKVGTGVKQINSTVSQQPVITIKEGIGPFPLALYRGGQSLSRDEEPDFALLPQTKDPEAVRVVKLEAGRDVNTATRGGVVNTGQMGNVSTGSGTQWNIGNQRAGRNIIQGSTVDKSTHIGKLHTGHGDMVDTGGGAFIRGNVQNSGGTNVFGGQVGNISYTQGSTAPTRQDTLLVLFDKLNRQIEQLPATQREEAVKAATRLKKITVEARQNDRYEPDEFLMEGLGNKFRKYGNQILSTAISILQDPALDDVFEGFATEWSRL